MQFLCMEQGQSLRKRQGADIPYKGLYGEALPEKDDWCRRQEFIKWERFFVEVYERVVVNLSFRYLKGPSIKKFRTDGP